MATHRRLPAVPAVLSALTVLALALGLLLAAPTAARAATHAAGPGPVAPAGTARLAATPPMGWNDWYAFACNLDEKLIEQTADTMVSSGMRAAGYRYVNLDDCWAAKERDAHGNLQADPAKFPHGIGAVADYVHRRGLKLGIYEDVGTKTCAGYPGSYGHVQQDADTFARWHVDFVKVDWCNVPFDNFPGLSQQQIAKQLYTAYGSALRATGRPMVFSICEWDPTLRPWTWAPAISNLWRTNNDYGDSWPQITANLENESSLARFAGPGHWNDPDILQVGLGGMSDTAYRAHFSMWSMLAAPLLAGNDLRSMSAATKATLTNREVIAVDQDRAGHAAFRLSRNGSAEVWARPLANGDWAVMLLNTGTTTKTVSTSAGALGVSGRRVALRDLWSHRTTETTGPISAAVGGQSAVLYRVSTRGAAAYPPNVEVSPLRAGRAAYPGSTLLTLPADGKTTAAVTFTDHGRASVTGVTAHLALPKGWAAHATSTMDTTVASGQSSTARWRVTASAHVKPGAYPLTATVRYRWRGGTAPAVSTTTTLNVYPTPAGSPYLGQLTPLRADNGYGPVVVDKTYYGGPLTIHGTPYAHGLWTNAKASLAYWLGGACSRFTADLGLDDSDAGTGSVDYRISVDGKAVYDSGTVTNSTPTKAVDVSVAGGHVLGIDVGDAGDGVTYDNADIAAPQLTCTG